MSMNKDKIASSIGREHEGFDSDFGYTSGSQREGQISEWQVGKQEEMDGFPRIPRTDAEDVRFSISNHSDEGTSDHLLDSLFRYAESLKAQMDRDGSGRILHDEDRARLLRKLDELKEQLSRACVVVDKPKEKVPVDGRVAPPESYEGADSWFPNGSSGSQKPPIPFYGLDKHADRAEPSYFSHFPKQFAYPVGNEMTRHGLYPPTHNPNYVPAYGNAFGPQLLGRTSHQLAGASEQQPPHPYFPRENIDSNRDAFMQYLQSSVLHHAISAKFGAIRPGHYWYDFRAGFWGVLGGPCLGIIHPCIEEFNYPMPGNCAGGTTGVFVNGRELHQKDLDLLASRGLPIDRDRFYIIEISGKVLDEDTGAELHSLGKLAPTVEKAKRGFGMKVPRAAHRSFESV
ncbi:Detected protein of unknown function [Hibiscus syriacus]|uniref:Uncharacterized protein n=1 Tax=Hibiscus syriacus TaxID=106335 RepID=A0A6A2YSQ1_HIBSY|nr:uncharacterized protein LOC120157381 [Hibiscus syriacus]KAE8682367.1 Detected protein of unknown function [Hibiscus syriacus]